jgi:acetyl esterase/lipase
MKHFKLSIAIILFVFGGTAELYAQSTYIPPIESVLNLSDNSVVYKNIRYGSIPDSIDDASSDRILDIYLPRNRNNSKLPVFIFIHGGGFRNGDKGVAAIQELCSKISSKDFAVLSINYRLTLKYKTYSGSGSVNMSKGLQPTRKFNESAIIALKNATEDTEIALKWIKTHAKKYNFNTSSVAIGGSSAGAITALNLAYISTQKIIPVKAVIDMWGGMANTELINKDAPPVLIYHGDNDKVVHVDYAYALKNQMDKIGNKKSILNIMEGQGHAQYDVILKEKVDEIVAFLRINLK